MNKKTTAALCSAALFLTGCQEPKPNVDNVDPVSFVQSVNTFNWDIFGQLDHQSNQFYSAYGISEALSLAANGAKEETLEELLQIYGVDSIEQLNEEALAVSNKVTDDGFVNANSIWLDRKLKKSEEFDAYEKNVNGYHDAQVKIVDFAGNIDGVREEITDWVKDRTKGFISDYKSIVTEETSADLINAVYFKGLWSVPFDINNTYDQKFYGLNEDKDVSMMHLYSTSVPYYENDTLKAIKLDYKDSSKSIIFITTKNKEDNIADIWNSLPNEEKNDLLTNLNDAYLSELDTIAIPNLEMDITMENLDGILKQLGIKTMFTGSADFSKIAQDLYVSDIIHRAMVKMDEEGTEAAAITEIEMDTMMAPMEEDILDFIADHPYLFVIRDTETGMILFTGLVQDLT